MKRILFVGLIALMVLLFVPAVMAADMTASGNLEQPAIEVSLDWNTPTFGNLITGSACNAVGGSGSGMPVLTTKVTGNGVTDWGVEASTADLSVSGIPLGHMYTSDLAQSLYYEFELGSDSFSYTDLNPAITDFMAGTSTGTYTDGLYMRQCISTSDLDGVYNIVVTFKGMVTGTS